MNAHTVGLVMKEMMRRATEEIWKRRIAFVGHSKVSTYKNDPNDLVTDADHASQAVILKKVVECFPGYGIVAEENDFERECTFSDGDKLFFTIDPLDGTKAFGRRQSHGFGPMMSLCTEKEVIAAFVGDAMSKEVFYYRPESEKVHRWNIGDCQYERLVIDPERKLGTQYVLLRDNPLGLSRMFAHIAQSETHGGLFKDIEVAGGGIGTGMARLWKGEVGAYVLLPGKQMPWDLWPVWGLSKKLGFIWMVCIDSDRNPMWGVRDIKPTTEPVWFESETIIIHQSRKEEFMKFVSKLNPDI